MTKEQLGDLILASQNTMYHIAKTILREDEDCADAMQETVVKAFSKRQSLRSDAYAKTWLMRILINICYDMLRQTSRSSPHENMEEYDTSGEQPPRDYSDLHTAVY